MAVVACNPGCAGAKVLSGQEGMPGSSAVPRAVGRLPGQQPITGFGLLGHLGETIQASPPGIRVPKRFPPMAASHNAAARIGWRPKGDPACRRPATTCGPLLAAVSAHQTMAMDGSASPPFKRSAGEWVGVNQQTGTRGNKAWGGDLFRVVVTLHRPCGRLELMASSNRLSPPPSGLQWLYSSGLRSCMAAASASLALAACGGGDSTVSLSNPTDRVPPDRCATEPRPAGCPDPDQPPAGPPMVLDGLSTTQKALSSRAVRETAGYHPLLLMGAAFTDPDKKEKNAVQFTTWLGYPFDIRLVNLTPSGSSDNVAYQFELYKVPSATTHPHVAITANGWGQTTGGVGIFEDKNKTFTLQGENAYTSVKRIPDIASSFGESWDYSILKASVPSVKDGDKDATLYAEVWTDLPGSSSTDYMVGGFWLLVPNNPTGDYRSGDYRFGAFARGQTFFTRDATNNSIADAVTGEATYKGNASGLFASSRGDAIQRLLGKVTLTADFQTTAEKGTIGGRIDSLTLNGESVNGQILLPEATFGQNWNIQPIYNIRSAFARRVNLGNIQGVNYQGIWQGSLLGNPAGNAQPAGVAGTVGGSGGGNSFVASFGAKKVEEE